VSERKRSTKRSDSWDLEVKPLTDAERAASSRVADRILGKLEPEPAEPIAAGAIAQPAIAAPAPVAPEPPALSQPAIDAPAAPVALAATVKPVAGRLYVPNTILDSLSEVLDPIDFKVYLRLFRLAYGWKSETCQVSHAKLASGCKIGKRTAQEATARLITAGLVELLPSVDPRAASVYRVLVPGMAPAAIAGAATADGAIAQHAPSKDFSKDMIKTAPAPAALSVYQIREQAARIFEAHRNDVGFDHDRLRELVRAALIGQGSAVDEAVLEEAIRGMG
jgi:hypothetical protein